jgi:hypothetical protein
MVESARDRLAELVSIHEVAKRLDKSSRTLRLWCSIGLAVPPGRIPALRKAGWAIHQRRVRLWKRRVGNDVRTTWAEVEKFLEATQT